MDDSLQTGSEQASNGEGGEICLPLEAVQIHDTSPAQGDQVEVTMKATVTRVENDMVYVAPDTYNDVPAPKGDMSEEELRQGMASPGDDSGY